MAPEVALAELAKLAEPSLILDPMVGSGTVVRHAVDLGHQAIGFDLDPLAVLMSSVWTRPLHEQTYDTMATEVTRRAKFGNALRSRLPWMDPETSSFIDFWFGPAQRDSLHRLAFALSSLGSEDLRPKERAALDALKVALSRIIVTKDSGASLARDVSHSRPHRVALVSNYDVDLAFDRSVRDLKRRLIDAPQPASGAARIRTGDARSMKRVADGQVDAVITSPPYLNAIDYMRGHKLSLVWLGHALAGLRATRSISIGSERRSLHEPTFDVMTVRSRMGNVETLPSKFQGMIDRYVHDLIDMLNEIARVLRVGGRAVMVVGDSCLRGVFVQNSEAIVAAAELAGLKLADRHVRELPANSRYLPLSTEQLSKRMRTETILAFVA